MNVVIEEYLANIKSLNDLRVKNLPMEIIHEFAKMDAKELYKTCTQFAILLNNVPTKDKILNLTQNEIEKYATEFAKEIRERVSHK